MEPLRPRPEQKYHWEIYNIALVWLSCPTCEYSFNTILFTNTKYVYQVM